MRVLILILMFVSIGFADILNSRVNANIGRDKLIVEVREKGYYIKCIEGYKWIQFLEYKSAIDDTYSESGLPIQLFGTYTNMQDSQRSTRQVPIPCN